MPTKLTAAPAFVLAVVLSGCPFFTSDADPGANRGDGTAIRIESAPAPAPAPAPRPQVVPTPAPSPSAAPTPSGETVSVRHILVQYQGSQRAAPDNERTKEVALERAQEALAKARAGEDFAELAAEYSDGPTRTRGGDLRSFGRGRMHPAFEQAAFSLEVDGVSDIVETPFGYHVILRYQ